ncbi:MAG: drug/metabolite exporter YedA [Myxococcales bacterium]
MNGSAARPLPAPPEGAPPTDPPERPAPRRGPAGAVLVALGSLYLIWGSTYLVIRVALPFFPPLQLAGLRFVGAGGLLYAILRLRGEAPPTRLQWRNSLWVGTLLVASNAFVCIAEQWVSSGIAAVLIASVPLWVALFATFFGNAPTRGELAGLAVGLCGVVLLNLGGELRGSPAGAAVLVCSTVSWAFGSIWSRRLALPRGLMASAAQMLCGGCVVLAVSFVRGDRLRALPPLVPALALAYLIVFGSMVGYSAYLFLLSRLRPAAATSYAYVNPVVAVALGALFAGEKAAPTALAALALILCGVGLVTLLRKKPARAA